ncbi:uncharacterized protein LOC127247430 [Andrographis paniculata]|uniref:uncharacterized protein LOC127247430 n=1 Tax=Andrographis paniculata TaxID=175694 RepID=UPI0021E7FD9D|nr:uncharacterized protein LOC127247430 [Andrographis paniculata]
MVFSGKGDSVPNMRGVSSLVQKWRDFEAEVKCGGRNNSASASASASASCSPSPSPSPSFTASQVQVQDTPAAAVVTTVDTNSDQQEDPFEEDWETYDRTAVTGPPSSRGRESDATERERERLRVVDIIRKLTEDPRSSSSSASSTAAAAAADTAVADSAASPQPPLLPLLGSPRIRGRQAYHDLLIQMEGDRRKELDGLVGRKAVSKFSHRGRIQAVLRIKFLRRGIEATEDRHSINTLSHSSSHKAMQAAANPHSRERLDPSITGGSVHSGRRGHKELTEIAPSTPAAIFAATPLVQGNQCQQVIHSKIRLGVGENHDPGSEIFVFSEENNIEHSSSKLAENVTRNNDEASKLSAFMSERGGTEIGNHRSVESVKKARTSFHDINMIQSGEMAESRRDIELKVHSQERKTVDQRAVKSRYDLIGDGDRCDHPPSYLQEDESGSNQELMAETATFWVSHVSSNPEVGWEEFQGDYQQQQQEARSYRDWIDEVSRPRSDWEYLRQERYQEMLDPFSDNEEIRVLLGRRSVSTFLSSGLREEIDRVMISRAQGQKTPQNKRSLRGDQKHADEKPFCAERLLEEGEEIDRVGGQEEEEEEEEEDYFDGYEEAGSTVGQQYNESSDDYMDYIAAAAETYQGRESSDCSYHAPSPPPPPPPPCTQHSSSSIWCRDHNNYNGTNSAQSASVVQDMELIYDLRRHMEQLRQEMSLLRRSIKCCMDMQIKLQGSIPTSLDHSDAKNGRVINSVKKGKGERRCCVCCKMQEVDSLLYRCGHMCTCYGCAQELQLRSRKCPVCAAPIVDVIRAKLYSCNYSTQLN